VVRPMAAAAAREAHHLAPPEPDLLQQLKDPRPGVCKWMHEFLHPREFMLLSFTGLLCTFLVFMSFVGHHDDELDDLRHWAQQPWEPVSCSVKQAGITYTGDCTTKASATLKFIKPTPSYNFTKCIDRMPESCDAAVQKTFWRGRRLAAAAEPGPTAAAAAAGVLRPLEEGEAAGSSSEDDLHAQERKLRGHRPGQFGQLCHNTFALWALMQVDTDGGQEVMCSYGAGLLKESVSSDWERTLAGRGELDSGASHTCWRLTLESIGLMKVHDCHVVALTEPKTWEHASEAYVQQQHGLQSVLMGVGGFVAVLGLVVVLVHHLLWKAGVERWSDLLAVDALSRLPCLDFANGSDSARARLTRERWGHFRANVLAEYRSGLPPSSRDYERVPASDPTCEDPQSEEPAT